MSSRTGVPNKMVTNCSRVQFMRVVDNKQWTTATNPQPSQHLSIQENPCVCVSNSWIVCIFVLFCPLSHVVQCECEH